MGSFKVNGCVSNTPLCRVTRRRRVCRYEEDYERLQAMNELLESEEAPLPQAALQQWLQKLDVGWNKLLEMWESRREVLVQAHIFHLFLRDVKQAESFLNNQVSGRGGRVKHAFVVMMLRDGRAVSRRHHVSF